MALLVCLCIQCTQETEHIAPAVYDKDSASVMTSYGVNTLISDSGIIKYRIITERWDINQAKKPTRWTFIKGLFFEKFDTAFHLITYVQADTAWYYDQIKLWELRGRVRVRNTNGMRFKGEEMFWDSRNHELYSYKTSILITPERTLKGTYFRSNEDMTNYTVSNSNGSFVKSTVDNMQDKSIEDTVTIDTMQTDSTNMIQEKGHRVIKHKKMDVESEPTI